MPLGPASEDELAGFSALIDDWAVTEAATNPLLAAVDHDPA